MRRAASGPRPNRVPNLTLDDVRQSLTATEPPAGLTPALARLWWDAKGDSTGAHESAPQDEGIERFVGPRLLRPAPRRSLTMVAHKPSIAVERATYSYSFRFPELSQPI
jgi:hypothetical protein